FRGAVLGRVLMTGDKKAHGFLHMSIDRSVGAGAWREIGRLNPMQAAQATRSTTRAGAGAGVAPFATGFRPRAVLPIVVSTASSIGGWPSAVRASRKKRCRGEVLANPADPATRSARSVTRRAVFVTVYLAAIRCHPISGRVSGAITHCSAVAYSSVRAWS